MNDEELKLFKEIRKGTNKLFKVIAEMLDSALLAKDESTLRRNIERIAILLNDELIENDEELEK
jgi:hypothetical protein